MNYEIKLENIRKWIEFRFDMEIQDAIDNQETSTYIEWLENLKEDILNYVK